MVNGTEELTQQQDFVFYGKEIRDRKYAGLFVEQRGPFPCELACKLFFTFLRDFGDIRSGSTFAFGSIPEKGAACANGV